MSWAVVRYGSNTLYHFDTEDFLKDPIYNDIRFNVVVSIWFHAELPHLSFMRTVRPVTLLKSPTELYHLDKLEVPVRTNRRVLHASRS